MKARRVDVSLLAVIAIFGAFGAVPDALADSPAAARPAPRPAPKPRIGSRSIADIVPCSACHSTIAWKRGEAGGVDGFDHAATGFPLTGQHAIAACSQCHGTGPVKRACVSCHEDVHRGRLSRSCDECHSAAGWQVTRAVDIHKKTRFPLSGMHTLSDCSECHQRTGDHQWTTAPVDCYACHARDFARTDIRPLHTGTSASAPFPRDCSQCHRSISWVPAVFKAGLVAATNTAALEAAPPPGHDLRFPISFGAHRAASCGDCHTNLSTPRSVRCIGCHAHDPARLTQQHKTSVPSLGSACLSCHLGGARR